MHTHTDLSGKSEAEARGLQELPQAAGSQGRGDRLLSRQVGHAPSQWAGPRGRGKGVGSYTSNVGGRGPVTLAFNN